MPLRSLPRAIGLMLTVLIFFSTPLRAQVQLGNETQVNLDGSISGGYSGSMTNEGPDGHGFTFGGAGNFTGSFHSPQFLSFDVSPFFNQSRNNSNYQSITDSSGMVASANIFGGSRFPGYLNYSKIYNSESIYSLPGIGNYATNGNSHIFGAGWSANLKDLPSLAFGYQQGSPMEPVKLLKVLVVSALSRLFPPPPEFQVDSHEEGVSSKSLWGASPTT